MSDDPRGCAVNPDGSLKDTADMDFVYSERDDPPAASSSALPPRSTRPDRLTQTKFNLANGTKRGGPALIVAGARQTQKRKANFGQSSSQPRKSRKKTTTSNAATASRKRARKAIVLDSDDDSNAGDDENGGSSDSEDVEEDQVTKYERLRKEAQHDRTASNSIPLYSHCSPFDRNLPNEAAETMRELTIFDLSSRLM